MFKYNQKVIVPFVIVFLIFGLFYIINEKNLSYNTTIKEKTVPDNINSCNKTKKKLNAIPSIKNNNDKIMKYVFENLQINNDDNLNLEFSENIYKKWDEELEGINAATTVHNKLELADYRNKQIGLKSKITNLLNKISIQSKKLQRHVPVEPTLVKPIPIEPAPVEPPVEPSPIEPAPVEPSPIEPAPVELAPVEPAAADKELDDYTKYHGVIQFGEFGELPDNFQNSSLGCINDIDINDAEKQCNNTEDCDSFFTYDSNGEGRVCFKNNVDDTQEQKPFNNPKFPNAGFFIKKKLDDYTKYPRVIQFGEFGELPDNFQNSSLGCIDDIDINDAEKQCNNTEDCDSFFTYDSNGEGRVCFKNNVDDTQEQKPFNNPKFPNAGFFIKKS